MKTAVKIVGYVVPMKVGIANFMVRGISDMVPAIGGTINLRGIVLPVTMVFLVILHRVWEKPVFMRNE
jgi:chemotaxis signal transduction protein